jgi:hypothetical protein
MKHRVNIVTAVNAKAVSKDGNVYTVAGVVGAVDDLVMNGRMYPADELKQSAAQLDGKPAPAGHPKNSKGQHISATNGEALASSWIGAYCTNARHEGGRTVCDIKINASAAKAHPDGEKLVQMLDDAIAGASVDPIHVSTGVFLREIAANGESRGKQYRAIATDLQYDHLAILLHEKGAGTPADGVGMWVNAEGAESEVETVALDTNAADLRGESGALSRWLHRIIGRNNSDEMSFDAIQRAIKDALPDGDNWPVEIYPRAVVWVDQDNRLWKQDYALSSAGVVSLAGEMVEVRREIDYKPIEIAETNRQEPDPMKDQIIAALNAAGIDAAGLSDAQALTAYSQLVQKPIADKLAAVNAEIEAIKARELAAVNSERDTLAEKLAVNSALTVDELKSLPLPALRKLAAPNAAPIVVGNTASKPGDEFAGYDINNPTGAK